MKKPKQRNRTKEIPPQRFESQPKSAPVTSLLDNMVDGKEYESIIRNPDLNINLVSELRKAIKEIAEARGKKLICYLSNVINANISSSTSIDNTDELPFSELVAQIPADTSEIDIMLVTPGGSAQQVSRFVDRLRPRFKNVSFLIPNMAMSAGTIFVMSGDEIVMNASSHIGPIDPQVPGRDGRFMPAQALLTVIDDIKKRGEVLLSHGQNPPWTDLQILKQIDAKEIGNAINASNYSIELVENYLYQYKFGTWETHSTGAPVTDIEKRQRAKDIAELLCNHSVWKTHSRGIDREVAWEVCKLRIIHTETNTDLDRAMRRFWALLYWIFENTPVYKMFISEEYCILRNDRALMNQQS